MRARALQLVQAGEIRRARWRLVAAGALAGVGLGLVLASMVEVGLALSVGAAAVVARKLRD